VKWLYALRNLSKRENVPDNFREDVFKRFFKEAEIAKLDTPDRDAYEQSLKYYRDMKNVIDTAAEERADKVRAEMSLALSEERRQKEEAFKRIAELEALLNNSGQTEA